ncbi:S1/P1 nuclease [Asinibacterium sp. OR53]|jgi:hypothetical protein|uniref:S1/P1 nuclease n=1 Tax=Asinibacterium sp. OR53 TaxID=925409 RepID=UPI000415EA62|nr:S1/P1 nuclease [Asinibacterium sp. OR53]
MTIAKKLFIIAALLYLPFESNAWGMLGHRIVGEIAETYLTAQARKEVRAILGNESLAMTANWPDFIKSDPSFNYLGPWHYINFDDGYTLDMMKEYLAKDTAVDAYTKLNFLIRELKKKGLDQEKKKLYLRLLVHIVGDVHQPMHTGRQSDLGGNRIRLQWFGEPTNLHAVWDEKLIDYQQLSYTEYVKAINFTTLQERKLWQSAPIANWLFESYEISRKLYDEAGRSPELKLSYRYNFDHINTLNERLLKGGVRLAGVLNEIFSQKA